MLSLLPLIRHVSILFVLFVLFPSTSFGQKAGTLPSDSIRVEVSIGRFTNLFDSASGNSVVKTLHSGHGFISTIKHGRLWFASDKGVQGWIDAAQATPIFDPAPFLDSQEAIGAISPSNAFVAGILRSAFKTGVARLLEERERKEREIITEEMVSAVRRDHIPLAVAVVKNAPNPFHMVDPIIAVLNTSTKTIKYIHFEIHVFNSVGDLVKGNLGQGGVLKLKGVGPLKPNEDATFSDWGTGFISRTASCLELRKVSVEFMDGGTYAMINDLENYRLPDAEYQVEGECAIN